MRFAMPEPNAKIVNSCVKETYNRQAGHEFTFEQAKK